MSTAMSSEGNLGAPWVLDRPWEDCLVTADAAGITVRSAKGEPSEDVLKLPAPLSRLGRLLPSLVPVLEEAGVLERRDADLVVSYDTVELLCSLGVDVFDDLVPWAPFALFIEGLQYLGSEEFRYRYGFFLGPDRISLERRGWFVRRGDQILRLDPQSYRVVEAMDRWNAGGEARSDAVGGLLSFSKIKGLAERVGAQLDAHLQCQNVVVPPKVGVDLVREPGDRISFVPRIPGIPETSFREDFFAAGSPEGPFSVSDDSGKQYQVIFDENLSEVVRRIWRVRHVGGAEATAILERPASVFDGVLSHVDPDLCHPDLDLHLYSDRVIGRGPLVLEPTRTPARTGVLDGETPGVPLTVRGANGVAREIHASYAELKKLDVDLEVAQRSGSSVVPFCGTDVRVDTDLREQVRKLVHQKPAEAQSASPPPPPVGSQGLLIRRNLEEQDYEVGARPPLPLAESSRLPKALAWADSLKPHQREGVLWLLESLRTGRTGCLLADDMGLGKTLQVLAFLAAAIENDERLEDEGKPDQRLIGAGPRTTQAPWNPILIVAPVILLENQTWQNDMKRFFSGEGSIFLPTVDLRGPELKRHRRAGTSGQETRTGLSHLDVESLRQYRVVLTNYETIVNYQFSLGQVEWSIVVTDEAQEFKTPSTRVAHAIKALKAKFRIAATGTPVETSLEDVWSIFDFLEPSPDLLGSLQEFRHNWAQPVSAELAEGRVADLALLRKKLGVGEPGGRVLRREKSDHVSLPLKNEIVLDCHLSEEQVQQHAVVLERARTGGPENHPLSLINQLLLLTQHPRLVPSYNGADPAELVSSCPKLARVLEELESIQGRREKSLVFARSIPMQQILREVFRWKFRLDVGIINGRSGANGEPNSSRNVRQKTLERFRKSDGFDILILSPEVAGLGLTIVEANHVFHYGRWWNPAKELQATDRAYRIGQEKEVFVYYPVASDPRKRFRSFDQSLDDLLRRRKELAREFLRPGSEDGQLMDELASELLGGNGPAAPPPSRIGDVELARMDGYGFEALVSAIERKRGRQAILTPTAGDEGIDVLSLESRVLWLLQCKHNGSGTAVDREALDDLRRGVEGWSNRRLRSARGLTLRVGLMVSGPVTGRLRQEAKEEGIEVWDGKAVRRLLEEFSVTEGEWQAAGAVRAASMSAVQAELASLLGNASA